MPSLDTPLHITILNHMVYIQNEQLDRAFSALADPTRRAILDQLARQDGQSVTELAQPFPVSLPAVMKHLDVLARANLIERAKSGRTVRCRLKAAPMESAMQWLARYEHFWNTQLDRLAAFLEEEQCSPNQASPSNAASKRRRRKSSARGRTRKS
jgi:DNA-binding transcriptional ArsR family regulator